MELPVTEGCPSPRVLFGFVCGVTRYRRVSQSMCFVWVCLWSYPLPKGVPVRVFSLALFVELPVTQLLHQTCNKALNAKY